VPFSQSHEHYFYRRFYKDKFILAYVELIVKHYHIDYNICVAYL